MVGSLSKVLIAVAIALMPLSVLAQSSSNCSNSSTVKINTCKNNRYVGDETRFYSAKDNSNEASGGYQNSIDVEDNQQLLMRVTLHNNARTKTAQNVRVKVSLPSGTVKSATSTATVSADGVSGVTDTFKLTNGKSFRVNYVQGSTRYYGANVPMKNLGDGVASGGIKIDGGLKAGENRISYLTFRVEIHEVDAKPAPVAKSQPKSDEAPKVKKVESQPATTQKTAKKEESKPKKKVVEESSVKTLPVESGMKNVTSIQAAQPVSATKTVPAPEPTTITVSQAQTQSQPATQPVVNPAPNPPEKTLPATGGALAGVFGSSALGYGLLTYRRSKSSLRQAVINKSQTS